MPSDDDIKQRTETETAEIHPSWTKKTISEHIMFIKG
jgi:hypothetical protein